MNKYQKILNKRAKKWQTYLEQSGNAFPFRKARKMERFPSSLYFDMKKEGKDVTNFIYDNIYR